MMQPHRFFSLSTPLIRCAALLSLLTLATLVRAVDVGQEAPDFSVTDAAGKPLQLATLRGKTVYVDFWASWCAPCRRSFPWMNAMHEKYGGNGLVVVGINVDKKHDAAERFLAQVPAKFAIGYDEAGATPARYAIKAMPSSVLIDSQGKVAFVHAGFRDEETADLEARIKAALQKAP